MTYQHDLLPWVLPLDQLHHGHDLGPSEPSTVAVLAIEGDVGAVNQNIVGAIVVIPSRHQRGELTGFC